MRSKRTFLQILHRWPGLLVALFLLLIATSGIIMNHRSLFSPIDVNRKLLPKEYHYKNWNNAALKGNVLLDNNSILVYGNIGVWLTDSTFQNYESLNAGFGKGVDNRKISDVLYSSNGNLYATTQFGLYAFNSSTRSWQQLRTNQKRERFVALEEKNDSIYALSRSLLYISSDKGMHATFKAHLIKAPASYDGKVSLFKTIWLIHSGELFGIIGKLIVDLLGVITIILSVTGIIYFFFPSWIKRRRQKQKNYEHLGKMNRFSLRWHNKIGAWTFLLLVLCYFTGMFLRPPLLLAIVNSKVAAPKYTLLDTSNAWYDKLRDLVYDEKEQQFIISTYDGMYLMNPNNLSVERCKYQPPVSVMGINCFTEFQDGTYIVGSFSGLFLWNPNVPTIVNYVTGSPYHEQFGGRPIGDVKISGLIINPSGYPFLVDYDNGIFPLHHQHRFPPMPEEIKNQGISLWNFALELHTLRIFNALIGSFYILLIPLVGLCSIMVLISGYFYWRKKYRRKKH